VIEPVLTSLTAHLDQLSVDEIIGRIERLPVEQQRELLALLSERLQAAERLRAFSQAAEPFPDESMADRA